MKLQIFALAAGLAALAAVPNANAATSFGTGFKYSWVTPMQFVPTLGSGAGCEMRYQGNFNFSFPANCTFFDAPVDLPEGTYLSGYRIYFIDNSASADLTSYINTVPGDTDTYTLGTSQSSTGQSTAVRSLFVDVDATVVSGVDGYHTVRLNVPSAASGITFRGARLFWQRQISPAPASASFNDVPTSHPFFREVQALVSSGVTQGCGGGAYCPDATVTRGQMAAFLSRALGL